MKHLFKVIILLFVPLLMMAFNSIDDVIKAFNNGNSTSISTYFDNTIDININGEGNIYSKSQGQQVLDAFFTKNEVSEFKVLHNVASPDGTRQTIVAKLLTFSDEFRVKLVINKFNNKEFLQEIKITKR